MCENKNLTEYKISKHAEERYAMRIMNKEDTNSINKFISENEDKIKTDINKLINYGDKIFSGKQSQKNGKSKLLNVFLKDCWIVLVDPQSNTVITLYKVDLGCGDEFNKLYISKMLEQLDEKKKTLEDIKSKVAKESDEYKNLISEAQCQINDYKAMIKNLENMCEGYQMIIDNNIIKVSQANMDVAECINTLIGKKEF